MARTTASAIAPTTRIAAIAASRRCRTSDLFGCACCRRGVKPFTGATPTGRFVEAGRATRPAGRTPSASSLAADATNRFGKSGVGPRPPERPGKTPSSSPSSGPSVRDRPVRRRRAHIPIESSMTRGSRTRPATSRGTKRTTIATKPRTTNAPTSHSTGDGIPRAADESEPAVGDPSIRSRTCNALQGACATSRGTRAAAQSSSRGSSGANPPRARM